MAVEVLSPEAGLSERAVWRNCSNDPRWFDFEVCGGESGLIFKTQKSFDDV